MHADVQFSWQKPEPELQTSTFILIAILSKFVLKYMPIFTYLLANENFKSHINKADAVFSRTLQP